MKKRSAEKVISRSILKLAVYRKSTMARAVRRRPVFWTVPRLAEGRSPQGTSKRLSMRFAKDKREGGFTILYDLSEPAAPPPVPQGAGDSTRPVLTAEAQVA